MQARGRGTGQIKNHLAIMRFSTLALAVLGMTVDLTLAQGPSVRTLVSQPTRALFCPHKVDFPMSLERHLPLLLPPVPPSPVGP